MNRIQTGYNPPDPRWPMPQSLLDKLTAARPFERDLPSNPWLDDGVRAGTRPQPFVAQLKTA